MCQVKRILLDVLKPHAPNPLEFALAIAEQDAGCRVKLTVEEVDEKTESVIILVEGEDIQFSSIEKIINQLGASLHSIDEVEVVGAPSSAT